MSYEAFILKLKDLLGEADSGKDKKLVHLVYLLRLMLSISELSDEKSLSVDIHAKIGG